MKVRESLLKETGNISPHRVSEETRKKVFDESEGIRNKMIEHYINSRQKFKQDEYERHRSHEESKQRMTQKWKEKMSNSPYLIDQYQEDEARRRRIAEKEMREKIYQSKLQLVNSMSGRASDVVLTKDNSKHLGPKVKLALGLRQSYRDQDVVHEERRILDRMLQDELSNIAGKFRALPVLDEISRSGSRTADETTTSSIASRESSSQDLPKGRRDTATNSYTSPKSTARSKHRKTKNNSLVSESSTFSGSLGYVSPNKRMKDLQEQVSVDFSMGKYENIEPTPEKRRA